MNIFKDTMSEMTYEQVAKLMQQEAIVLFPVGIIEEHGFSGEEDYILKLTDMPFEEMFQISKMPEDAFDVHAGAFETATMREIYPEAVRENALIMLEPTFLQGEQISKWCNGAAVDKTLIPNGYVGDPKGSQYIETSLKEADRRIAMDIVKNILGCNCPWSDDVNA